MTSTQPEHFEDDFSEYEIESQAPPPPDTDAESSRDGTGVQDEAEEGLLDQVLTSTDRLCCGRGKAKSDDIESGNTGEGNLVPEAPLTENGGFVPGDSLADEKAALADQDPSAPSALTRDVSSVKESVEIKAHFDKDDDGITLISDNGLDTTAESEKIRPDVSEEQQTAGRRRLQLILAAVAALIFIIGLSVGLAGNNKEQKSVAQAASASSSQNTSDKSPVSAPTLSPYILVPTTAAPVSETSVVGNETSVVGNETSAPEVDPPTEAPVGCVDSISVDATCYEFFNDEIQVTFNVCDPVRQDWVALYPEGSDVTSLPSPQSAWLYTCGDQFCTGRVQQGTVSLGFQTDAGTYQAYLISNAGGDNGAPYTAIASSEPFEITVGKCT